MNGSQSDFEEIFQDDSTCRYTIERSLAAGHEYFEFRSVNPTSEDLSPNFVGRAVLMSELAVIYIDGLDDKKITSAIVDVDNDLWPWTNSSLITERTDAAKKVVKNVISLFIKGNLTTSEGPFLRYLDLVQDKERLKEIRQVALNATR